MLPKNLIALCSVTALSFLSLSMTRPLVPLFASELGAGPVLVGLVVATFAAFPFFAAVPAGALTDRLGARTMIVWGSFGCAIFSLVPGWWPTLGALLLSQAVIGTTQLGVIVGAQTLAGSAAAGEARERSLGWFTTANSCGQLAGPLVGGWIADHTSFATSFIVAGLIGLATPLAALALPSVRGRARMARSGFASLPEVRRLLRHEGVKAGILSSFAVLFTVGVRQAFFPLYVQGLGYSATVVGGLLSVHAFASVMVRPFMSTIITVCRGRFRVLAGSLSLLATGVLIIPVAHSLPALALTSVFVGIGIGLCQPLSMLTVADSVSGEIRGLAMGVRLTGNRLAQLVNPIFFGAVTAVWGLTAAFVLAGLLLFGSTAYLFRWKSHFHRSSEPPGDLVA